MCIYIYIYVRGSSRCTPTAVDREMGGAPRNPAPRNRFLAWIVKPSGCHCTDASGGKNIVECRPLSGALPLSLSIRSTQVGAYDDRGTVLKRRNSLRKSLCPVVVCPYLCSSDMLTAIFHTKNSQTKKL